MHLDDFVLEVCFYGLLLKIAILIRSLHEKIMIMRFKFNLKNVIKLQEKSTTVFFI